MNLEIRISTLRKSLTIVGLLFYCGFVSFLFRVISGGVGGAGAHQSSDLEGNAINQLIGLAIMAVCIFLGFRFKLLVRYQFWRHNWAVLLFVGCVFASISWSVEPAISMRRAIALLAVVAFSCYLAQLYSIEQLFRILGLMFASAAVLGLVWAVVAPGKAFISGGLREGAFLGIFADKNGGARAYVLAILMLLPFSLQKERLALAASGACLLCLALAQSASGVMLLAVGGATAIYLNFLVGSKNIQLNATRVMLGLCIYTAVATSLVLGYQMVLELIGRDPTLTDRTLIWELIIPLMLDKVTLGYGFGAFWAGWGAEEFIERWGYIGNAHNGYIEIMLHGGLVLMTCFALATITTLLALLGIMIRAERPIFLAVAIAAILQMLVANFISYALPNYRAYDFFIYMVIAFSALNHWREPLRAGEKGL